MKMRIVFTLIVVMLCLPYVRAQQEVQLSQYMFNGLTINPALAGSHEALNAQLLYRRQWQGFEGAPQSAVGSVDGVINQSNSMGWGLSVVGEQIGLMKTLGTYASYAYRVRLNELDDRLSLGLSLGVAQGTFGGINPDLKSSNGMPIYSDSNDDVLASEEGIWRPDFRVGAYYNYGKMFYAGLSASNLGSFIKFKADSMHLNNPHIYLNAGMHYYLDEKWRISPSLLAQYTFNENPVVDANVAASLYDKFWLGVGVRLVLPLNQTPTRLYSALAAMAEVWVTQSIRLGYCYDYTMARIGGVQSGSHEVSFGFTLSRKVVVVKTPTRF
jgi:type IX secretion system PorP/SprF family membrane protein